MSNENDNTPPNVPEMRAAAAAETEAAPATEAPATAVPTVPPLLPPPPGVSGGLHDNRSRFSDHDLAEIGETFRSRHRNGVFLGLGGFAFVGFAIVCAERSIDRAFATLVAATKDPISVPLESLLFATFAVQAVVSVAAVYFGYSMLRASERLLVPRHLLIDKQDVDVLRAILGIDTPTKAATDQVKNTVGDLTAIVAAVAKPLADAIKTIVDRK